MFSLRKQKHFFIKIPAILESGIDPFLANIPILYILALSWRRSLSYRNQSIDLLSKSIDWFLYDRDLLHERVNNFRKLILRSNIFHTSSLLLYRLNILKNLGFSDVVEGFRKRPVSWNGLTCIKTIWATSERLLV